MSERAAQVEAFLAANDWASARRTPLAGDASARAYQRLEHRSRRAVLMDAPPGPDMLVPPGDHAYGQGARLTCSCAAFVAIGEYLRNLGLSSPCVLAWDNDLGLVLMEDLGDDLFARNLRPGTEQERLCYQAAVDVLIRLHEAGEVQSLAIPPTSAGAGAVAEAPHARTWDVPRLDGDVLAVEAELFAQWYAPAAAKLPAPLPEEARCGYHELWRALHGLAENGRRVLVLRDYHSPNLLWLAGRQGSARVGLLDYQDALCGSAAYDLVSLLQDARRDVPEELERLLLNRYVAAARASAGFCEETFRAAYAVWGAQRNARIMGLFVRLARREAKPEYLVHMPRVRACLERNLAHPALAHMRAWMAPYLAAAAPALPS